MNPGSDLDRQLAAELFRSGLTPATSAVVWGDALDRCRLQVTAALAATKDLSDVASGLEQSGAHSEVLRALMAPRVSQDRFSIICPAYSKASEKSGKPVRMHRSSHNQILRFPMCLNRSL